jgi:FMN reductase
MSILLLGGSPSLPSSSSRLLQHIGERLALQGHRYAKLQVRDLPAQALLHADCSDPALKRALALVADADALVIATPIYKAAYSGLLKAFLDLLPQDGLAGKFVLPVATGGSQSHMLALDYALRPVLSSLSARHVLAGIYATSDQLAWDADTGLLPTAAIDLRIDCGVSDLSAALFAAHSSAHASVQAQIRAGTAGAAGFPAGALPTRSLSDFPYTAANGHAA